MTKSGYTLDGWYTDDGTFANRWDFANDIVTTDITLYAKWEVDVASSLVFQFYTDQTGTTPASGSVTPQMTETLSTLEYSLDLGNTWKTWTSGSISSNGTNPIYFKGSGSGLYIENNWTNAWTLSTWCRVTGDITALLTANMYDFAFSCMFYNCSKLLTAPTLSPMTLATSCYYNIFRECTNLTQIRVRFTSWPSSAALDNIRSWVYGVPSGGTFYCPPALPDTRGTDYIPTGWTKANI